ncbi:hypothetical protein BO79DRAFT_236812 [Aspergillus costaricaensis CBS 115574]|uniref:Uncharacterized protein n=1 Tax=Aspergillus costaricaensis CBS 115574 TaxID=1448317 RepID=A0ACD1II32_9EURO|nr:hypothetical protein BO79DRAFT_236812 [Aspergillus costaricaensis CBS 115574]RAK90110.1 hypothetical protein BO79DRAFT_236812 [Aspergillus costaricaensis CBS 115574]
MECEGWESRELSQGRFERGEKVVEGEEKDRNFIGDEDETFGGVKHTPMKSDDGRKANRIWDGIPSIGPADETNQDGAQGLQKEYDNAETSNANRNKRRERGKEKCMKEERESETKR